MSNKKAMTVILILIIAVVVFVLAGLYVGYRDQIQDWLYDKVFPLRLYRPSLTVSFSQQSDEECLETIFRQLDIEVRNRTASGNTVEYALSSVCKLPDGWMDGFGKKAALGLLYPDGQRIDLDGGIQSIAYENYQLILRFKDDFWDTVTAIEPEKACLCVGDDIVKLDLHPDVNEHEFELPVFVTKAREEAEALFIRAIVSFYSYPSCSEITVSYS